MRALLRFIPKAAQKWVLIGLAVILVIGILTRLLGRSAISGRVIWICLAAVVAIAAVWVLIHFMSRAARKRKQRTFDASLAAKEGIEDRKREWQSWVQELEKADIDRYELPFYLLLGEPQSGKSILLQNSDLNFLFGQSRLSGVGGTRGCDWWFTQEAVILDLAGRLFTHEGGAADEAEWEAFLDLLNGFRPMDPANGIMLVIPCDSLLTDTIETSRQKASQIREALFTLTRKLQAKLPIYVILTKGDKIFGFAESVHRLEAEQRKQMFGWSRPLDRLEHPFQSDELAEAWDGFVASASSLRDSMLATARIPEAIPEVDRMMAFPSELQGMYMAVDAYMTRIFQGSDLLDQLYFRGIYLTSGLQSGAPIAKVGLEILDRPGDADNRDLESLFVRQQAYFIRDLVRRRVFAERGLVRPTGARTKRVQKNAWIGYGVAAGFAALAAIWCAVSFFDSRDEAKRKIYAPAIAVGEKYTTDTGRDTLAAIQSQGNVGAVLEDLSLVNVAITDSNEAAQDLLSTNVLFGNRAQSLQTLKENLTTKLFGPSLQDAASKALLEQLNAVASPMDASAFIRGAQGAEILSRGIQNRAEAVHLLGLLPEGNATATEIRKRLEETVDEGLKAPACSHDSMAPALAAIEDKWDGLTTSGSTICLEEPLRTFVALFEVEQESNAIALWQVNLLEPTEISASCTRLSRALLALGKSSNDAKNRTKTADLKDIKEFLDDEFPRLILTRKTLRGEDAAGEDTRLHKFAAFLRARMKNASAGEGVPVDNDLAVAELEQARADAYAWSQSPKLQAVLDSAWGTHTSGSGAGAFHASLNAAVAACTVPETPTKASAMRAKIAQAKTRGLVAAFLTSYPSWDRFAGESPAELSQADWSKRSAELVALRPDAKALGENPAQLAMDVPALEKRLATLGEACLNAGNALLSKESSAVATDLAKGILAHRTAFELNGQSAASDPVVAHLNAVYQAQLASWAPWRNDTLNQAGEIASWTASHLNSVAALTGQQPSGVDVASHVESVEGGAAAAINDELSGKLFQRIRGAATDRASSLSTTPAAAWMQKALAELTGTPNDSEPFDTWFDICRKDHGIDKDNLAHIRTLEAATGSASASDVLKTVLGDVERLVKRSNSRAGKTGVIAALSASLETLANIRKHPKRAEALVDFLEQPDQTGDSIEATFARELRAQIAQNMRQVLREEYFKILGRQVVDHSADLLVLWESLEESSPSAQSAALRRIFGKPDGWYPTTLSSFRLRKLKGDGNDFRQILDGEEDPDGEMLKLRTLDDFLEKLARYLHGPDGTTFNDAMEHELALFMNPENDARFGFTLKPSKELLGASNGGWRQFSSIKSRAFVDEIQSIQSGSPQIFSTRPVESWSYGGAQSIDMTLKPPLGSGPAVRDRKWNTSSPMAPLYFRWQGSHGDNLHTITADGANFVIKLDEKEDVQVEFTITFPNGAPPVRPRLSKTPLRR